MKVKILSIAILVLFTGISALAQQLKTLSATELVAMLKKDKKLVLLDVRTPEEFSQGHLKGAKNFNLHDSTSFAGIKKLDKNAKYIVYCRTKNRSGVAASQMIKDGFKNVSQMTDGFSGWSQLGLPFEK